MRIEAIQVTPIALGDPPLLNASGLHAPYALRIILEIVTEHGISGLSEIPGDARTLARLRQVSETIQGASVYDAERFCRALDHEAAGDDRSGQTWDSRQAIHVASALEVACLDAIARRLDCRVVDLLGGAARDRVPYAGYLFFKYEGAGGALGFAEDPSAQGWAAARQRAALDVDGLVSQARAMISEFGFDSVKVKAGILSPDIEVAATLALRDTFGPDMRIRIDPNAVWSYETALSMGERLRGVIEYYEDPVRGQQAMARLRSALAIPLATNMCTTGFGDLPSSLALGSEDIILADHHFWGGLRASMDLARICEVFGRGISMHSNSHAAISLAAMTHLGAALPQLTYSLDTHYPWQQDEVIVGGRLLIRDGSVMLPDAPGLGVQLDRVALAAAHERYLASGLVHRDDEAAMQARQPGWRFKETRY